MRPAIGNMVKLIAAVILPGFIVAIYLDQSRLPEPHFTELSDDIAGIVALGVGICLVATMTLQRASKLIAIVLYIPFEAIGLFAFAVGHVCSEFGACL